MIFGLVAAVTFGVADVLAAVATHRMRELLVAVLAQGGGLIALAILVLVVRPALEGSVSDLWIPLTSGVLAAGAYVCLYRALHLGPIALVSPIVSAFGAVTVTLAVLLVDEALRGLVLAGTVVTIGGVILASADLRELRSGAGLVAGGIPYALGAMLLFGVAQFLQGFGAREIGWLPMVGTSRTTSAVLLLAAGVFRSGTFARIDRTWLLPSALIGVCDVVGLAFFAQGAVAGSLSVVAASSSTFTLIPVAFGVALLDERPAPSQWLGVAMVIGGLVMLGLGR